MNKKVQGKGFEHQFTSMTIFNVLRYSFLANLVKSKEGMIGFVSLFII